MRGAVWSVATNLRMFPLVSKAESGEEREIESGIGLGATAEALVRSAQGAGYAVAAAGQNRFRMAKTTRPRWATILAIVLLPLAGLGLLLLLIRSTASLDATVQEHHKGVRVRVTGTGVAQFADLLRPALVAQDRRHMSEASFAPGSSFGADTTAAAPALPLAPISALPFDGMASGSTELLQMTLPASGARPVASAPIDAPTNTRGAGQAQVASAVLVTTDGSQVPLASVTVIGRDPSDDGTYGVATKWAVAEPSLSKTHAYIGPSGAGAWVVDQHSTNGTVISAGGVVRPCAPGVRIEVPVGAFVVLGDLRLEVVSA